MNALALLVPLAIVELLGPGSRQIARNQSSARADGTGQFLELAVFPSPGTSGFSQVQLWTSKWEAGKYSRVKLQEKELQLPDASRIARELYDFPFANYISSNAATAENRVAVLCGTTDNSVRTINLQSLTLGPSVALPVQARNLAWRPGAAEVWVAHAGIINQISIVDPVNGKVSGSIPFRLLPQAVPVALLFSNSGRTAYAVVRNPDSQVDRSILFVIDTVSRTIRTQISLGTTVVQTAAISPDGATIYLAGTTPNSLNTAEPSLTSFDTQTNAFSVFATGLSLIPAELVFHPNGTKLYWLVPQSMSLEEFDIQMRKVSRRIALPRPIQPVHLGITPMGDILIVRDAGNQLAAHIDSETGDTLDTQAIPAGPGATLLRLP
ncbi:hypothetical protein [Bryobacter aggregatus]|uniref:hypothetical protein n=1 Tax=Bryobacter aggregatus TaxID=360054 RepID=UPI0004E14EDE|nr:hypothetical protein [Bryobacter aggregatus]